VTSSRQGHQPSLPWAYLRPGFTRRACSRRADARFGVNAGGRPPGGGRPDALSKMARHGLLARKWPAIAPHRAGCRDEARDRRRRPDDLGSALMVHQARAINGLVDGDSTRSGPPPRRGCGSPRGGRSVQPRHDDDDLGSAALGGGGRHEAESGSPGPADSRQLDDRFAGVLPARRAGCCAAESRERGSPRTFLGAPHWACSGTGV